MISGIVTAILLLAFLAIAVWAWSSRNRERFADAASERHGLAPHSLQPAQRAMLLRHEWPGNVRELQNAAERFALGLELAHLGLEGFAGQGNPGQTMGLLDRPALFGGLL